MSSEIILYQANGLSEKIEVRIEDETVWLSQQQMAELFQQTKQNISLHINNCFKEKELKKTATVKESLTVQKEGSRTIKRMIEYYNLDVIISVGYRVKSKQGTQFRIWATRVLREYLLKGYALNQRVNRIENTVENLATKVHQIDFQIKSKDLPQKGIFYNGQVFDAWHFVSDIVRSAKKSIILIDNYIDDSVLTLFAKRRKKVAVTLLTKKGNAKLSLDIQKFNAQYEPVTLTEFTDSHDRFLIIDESDIYHIGASLKDLGKKWFAFSKIDIADVSILDKLKKAKLL
ncbi:MAG: hypothetical protein LDLANPLL_00767 [Turneriella sp.]|nr:hypothetical protein [Turneriella sp.]